MQPTPEPPCPSASMGVEWMGSDSEALEATVKRMAKESIVVWVWMRCEDQRDGLTKCLRIIGSLTLPF
jgi:hypothetical protein